jgi:Phage terminase large subunit
METQAITYNQHPSAIPIHDSDARVKAVSGPVGSGKTSVGCWEFFILCLTSTVPIRGVVIRSSYRELHDSTRHTFEEWFDHPEKGMRYSYRKQDEEAHLWFTGADGVEREHTLAFRACKRDGDASKFLSTEYAFIWLEEVVPAFIREKGVMGQGLPKGVFDVAQMRLRQKGAPRLEIFLTFNPPSTRHWVYKEFFLATPADLERKSYALFRQPPGENKDYLPERYYEGLIETLSPELARRFILGEVTTTYEGERVYPECQDNVHVVENLEPMPGVPLTLGQDYGLTPCCLVTQILPGGQWLWLGELQLWNKGIKAFVEFLLPFLANEFGGYRVKTIWQDPNGGNVRSQTDETETCGELLRSGTGFEVKDGNNSWALRREVMKQRFEWFPGGKPGVLIDRNRCPLATEGVLGGYRYPMTAAGIPGSSPIKNDLSHIQDCAQMIATGEFSHLSGLTMGMEAAAKKQIVKPYNPLADTRRAFDRATAWLRR